MTTETKQGRRWQPWYRRLEQTIVPGLQPAEYVYRDALLLHLRNGMCWLDAGCGRGILPKWMDGAEARVIEAGGAPVGIDADPASLRDNSALQRKLAGDLGRCPFRDGSFELVAAHFVVEHLASPLECLREVHRILRPGGIFIFHTPNIRHYQVFLASLVPQAPKNAIVRFLQGREADDVFPAYYRLNTPNAIERQAVAAGFEIMNLKLVNSTPQTIKLGRVVALELLVTRALNSEICRTLRSNIVVVLQKRK